MINILTIHISLALHVLHNSSDRCKGQCPLGHMGGRGITAMRTAANSIGLNRAVDFSIAYTLTWAFNIVGNCLTIADVAWPTAIWYLANIFNPLQGVFNFMIFVHPKVASAKNKRGDMSCFQAFAKVCWPAGGAEHQPPNNNRDKPHKDIEESVDQTDAARWVGRG